MSGTEILKAIEALRAEEETLIETIKKSDLRLAQIRAALSSLVALDSDEPLEFQGKLADACRNVLRKSAKSLTPLQVRDEVKAIGYDFVKNSNSNPMAAIHSVLKRLVESGEAESKEAKDGSGTRYYWVHPVLTIDTKEGTFTRIQDEAQRDLGRMNELLNHGELQRLMEDFRLSVPDEKQMQLIVERMGEAQDIMKKYALAVPPALPTKVKPRR